MKLPHLPPPCGSRRVPRVRLGVSLAAFAAVTAVSAEQEAIQATPENRPAAAQQQPKKQPAAKAERQSAIIRGRIEGFRHVRSRGGAEEQQQQDEQTLVNVRLQDGRTVAIALGPKTDLDALGLQRNDFIAVEGRAAIVEGVPALVAARIDVNGQRVAIRRGSARKPQAQGRPAQDRSRERQQGQQDQQQGQKQPVIDADTRRLVDEVRTAYRSIHALQLAGTVSTHIEAGDTALNTNLGFTSSYQAPNKFRHDTADMLIGSTGGQAFVFNKKTNNYLQEPVAANQLVAETLPASARAVLHAQDPSLLAAMLRWPFQGVLENVERVEKLDDAVVDGKRFPQLVLRGLAGHGPISVLIDPETHLVRRVSVNLRPALHKKGDHERVRQADVVIDYTMINPQPKFEADRFAWQPPAQATDIAQQRASEHQSAQGLVGKEAPDFQLTALDGRKVSLADLRGKVVVLDFWASWCPPCQESLPHLGRIYSDKEDEGVEFYAINVGEEKDRIQTFLRMQGIGVPVLLDPQGKVAQEYGVGGIPKTVVIGKDGKVTEVFTGLGDDTYRQIRDAIAQAHDTGAPAPQPGAPAENAKPTGAS